MRNVKIIASIIVLFISFYGRADITPSFSVVQEISFGQTLFIPGNCYLDPETGYVSDLPPSIMCVATGTGKVGHYVIIANPNKQIRIKILQKNNDGDGFIFTPEGFIESDTHTEAITVNVAQEINSGNSGVVDIFIGGQLYSTEEISPSSIFSFERTDGIEWEELP